MGIAEYPFPANPTPLDHVLFRLAFMQEAAYPGSDAVPAFAYTQEGPPFWVNHVPSFSVRTESQDLQIITYNIEMILVLAKTTEGVDLEAEQRTHYWLPTILQYFGERRQLKRTSADDPIPYLYPEGAYITGGNIDYELSISGIGQPMFGLIFNESVPMYQETEQVVF